MCARQLMRIQEPARHDGLPLACSVAQLLTRSRAHHFFDRASKKINGLKNLVCGNARQAACRESALNTISLFGVYVCTPTDAHFYTPIFLPSHQKKLRGVQSSGRRDARLPL